MPKLYELPRDVRVRLEDGMELHFYTVDGMYSLCKNDDGGIVHLAAWTEVELVKEQEDEQSN